MRMWRKMKCVQRFCFFLERGLIFRHPSDIWYNNGAYFSTRSSFCIFMCIGLSFELSRYEISVLANRKIYRQKKIIVSTILFKNNAVLLDFAQNVRNKHRRWPYPYITSLLEYISIWKVGRVSLPIELMSY